MIELDAAAARDAPARVRAAPTRTPMRTSRRSFVGVLAWCALVVAGYVLVRRAKLATGMMLRDAAPLHATFAPEVTGWVLLAIACACSGVLLGPRFARSASWRGLLAGSWGLAAVWAGSLAAIRGWERIAAPLARPGEYLAVLPRVHSVGGFLGAFVADIRSFPVHVQGHPPGFVLVSWLVERVGFGGSLPVSLLCIVGGAATVPAVLMTAREVAGADVARRAAPFLVLAPAAIWIATSADALYAGVGAWAVTLVVLATGRRDRRGDLLALGGGLLFGITAFLSYGLVLLAVLPLVVARHRRRARPVILACVGALPVFVGFLAAGFWWADGLLATRRQYFTGIASRRPYATYLVADLASFAILLGPAIGAALLRLRDRRLWLVSGGALLAVALADLSGMSKAEVERIWLPFAPFVLAATAALALTATTVKAEARVPRSLMAWLALQAGFAIVLESVVRTGW